jgi:hypothetical protein
MYRPRASLGPEELLGGFYYHWSGAVRADFVTANFAELFLCELRLTAFSEVRVPYCAVDFITYRGRG